jgi:CubicO group peptidase (beta-lactamase class C family)
MDKWLKPALDYIPQFLDYQLRQNEQPGCVIAIAHRGKIVLEAAFGNADLVKRVPLTPRHRFRVASHSKSFTAAGVMKLREAGKLRLDDPAGRYVAGLHRSIAQATIAQLLSHSAGIIRDGTDNGQWQDRRPFLDAAELRAALAETPVLEANTRFKYSNHGFGLAGLVIESVTGESYRDWIQRAVVDAVGLAETMPDMPIAKSAAMASGHGAKLPLGHRVVVPARNPTHALASATGFVSTARDLARFFAQLDPASRQSVLSPASRREMIRRQWRDPDSSLERYYGLGIMSGRTAEWDWFGHGGAFQGFISRTGVLPENGLTVSLVTNAVDGFANQWFESVLHILRGFATHGAPTTRTRGWTGRWWTLWSAVDLVPMGERVLVAQPALLNPLLDASEIVVTGKDRGRIALATGFAAYGEGARLVRGRGGKPKEFWLAGTKCLAETPLRAELEKRYRRSAKG